MSLLYCCLLAGVPVFFLICYLFVCLLCASVFLHMLLFVCLFAWCFTCTTCRLLYSLIMYIS